MRRSVIGARGRLPALLCAAALLLGCGRIRFELRGSDDDAGPDAAGLSDGALDAPADGASFDGAALDGDASMDGGADGSLDGSTDAGLDAGVCPLAPAVRIDGDGSRGVWPWLAWNGSGFGAVWEDDRSGNREIFFVEVDAGGAAVSLPDQVTATADGSRWPKLVWNGAGYGLLWGEYQAAASRIFFLALDATGAPLGAPVDVGRGEATGHATPDILWTGSDYVVTWHDNTPGSDEIFLTRLDVTGASLQPTVAVSATGGSSLFPSVAWTGSNIGVAWNEDDGADRDVYFRLLGADGAPFGDPVRITQNPSSSYAASLAWSGTEFGVSFWDDRDGVMQNYFVRISAQGEKLGDEVRLTTTDVGAGGATLVWNGSHYAMAWYDFRDGVVQAYFSRFDRMGRVLEELNVSNTTQDIWLESLAMGWAGDRFAVWWSDETRGSLDPYVAIVDCQ